MRSPRQKKEATGSPGLILICFAIFAKEDGSLPLSVGPMKVLNCPWKISGIGSQVDAKTLLFWDPPPGFAITHTSMITQISTFADRILVEVGLNSDDLQLLSIRRAKSVKGANDESQYSYAYSSVLVARCSSMAMLVRLARKLNLCLSDFMSSFCPSTAWFLFLADIRFSPRFRDSLISSSNSSVCPYDTKNGCTLRPR